MKTPALPTKITITNQDLEAKFASEFHIMHNPNEFVLTMLEVIPQMKYTFKEVPHPKTGLPTKVARMANDGLVQKVVGRFGMSPATMKKLVTVLNQNVKNYEAKFGEISINPPEGLH